MKRKQAWTLYKKEEETAIEELCSGYRRFLDAGKTERECIKEAVRLAKKKGYRKLSECGRIKPGDKVYAVHSSKTAVFFQIGTDLQGEVSADLDTDEGAGAAAFRIIGAHVDSPRLDVKQVPLYEESNQVYLDTHYYGGIKKYQWLSLPLALHGVVVHKDGTKTLVQIGEKEEDPVFVITDLLPHLGKDLLEKKVREFIDAEKLDLLIGNRAEKGGRAVEYIRQLLMQKYRIREEDFLSAELEVVPAGSARDCGLDGSMILAYGQDDRSCAYAALLALLESSEMQLELTCCCILADKEETGSRGATGMHSRFFENTVADLLEKLEIQQDKVQNGNAVQKSGDWGIFCRIRRCFPRMSAPHMIRYMRPILKRKMPRIFRRALCSANTAGAEERQEETTPAPNIWRNCAGSWTKPVWCIRRRNWGR